MTQTDDTPEAYVIAYKAASATHNGLAYLQTLTQADHAGGEAIWRYLNQRLKGRVAAEALAAIAQTGFTPPPPPFNDMADAIANGKTLPHPADDGFSEQWTRYLARLAQSHLTKTEIDATAQAVAKPRKISVTAFKDDVYTKRKENKAEGRNAEASEALQDGKEKLYALNKRYAVAKSGASVRVMDIPDDPDKMPDLLRVAEFCDLHRDMGTVYVGRDTPSGDPIQDPLPVAWMHWGQRRSYKGGIEFDPDMTQAEGEAHGIFNIWRGFKTAPDAGGSWDLLQAHMLDNVCQGRQDYFDWLMTWMADIFQNPGTKRGSAVVLLGKRGTGKSKLGEWIDRAIGPRHAVIMSDRQHLVNRFGGHRYGMVFGLCEEAFYAGDKESVGIIKHMITGEWAMMEKKNVDAVRVRNLIRLFFTSNEKWVVPAGLEDERRFFVLEVLDGAHRGDAAYFGAIDAQMESGGVARMVFELLAWDPEAHGLTWDSLRNPPHTQWLKAQGDASLDGLDTFFRDMVRERGCPPVTLPGGETLPGFHIAGDDMPHDWDTQHPSVPALPMHRLRDGLIVDDRAYRTGDGRGQFLPWATLRAHVSEHCRQTRCRVPTVHQIRDAAAAWLDADVRGEAQPRKIAGMVGLQRCLTLPMMGAIDAHWRYAKGIEPEHTFDYAEADPGPDPAADPDVQTLRAVARSIEPVS